MKNKSNLISLSEIGAVGTWAIVFGLSVYFLSLSDRADGILWVSVVGLFLLYIGCFIAQVREGFLPDSLGVRYTVMAVQLGCAFALIMLIRIDFLAILTIIWVSILPHVASLKRSILIMLLVVVVWNLGFALRWGGNNLFLQALLFMTFHFFAIVMSYQTRKAEQATLESQRLNQELQATQNLLAEASRQNERTRIARDLHDLLGHHLTALIINLQVAGHLSDGEAKVKIDQCHSLAKLLLSDVREAVTTMRENQSLDFHKMVELLVSNTPKLKIHSHIDATLNLDDLELAKALLSVIQEAITNSLRHSGADQMWINLRDENETLKLEMYDNGQIRKGFVKGNGLNGIQERISALSGTLDLGEIDKALKIFINIPQQKLTGEVSS